MTISNWKAFQYFKYAVYLLLAMNVYWFFAEEVAAARVEFPDGVSFTQLIEAFPAAIDTANWLVLLLMFELETYVLEDRHSTPRVRWALHGLRSACYALILYAFYGYITTVTTLGEVSLMDNVHSLCALASESWSYAIDLDEYVAITVANCATFTDADAFYRIRDLNAVVDASGLRDIRALAWVDVINAGVWILVVLVLEMDVRLQERGVMEGGILKVSNAVKFVLYSILFLAAIYWGIKGDFVDFWDAFLWLVAFFFIEMNVVEWRQEAREEQAALAT